MPKLIASRGQVLCSALPYVCVLMHKESDKHCAYCFKCEGELLKCSACQMPRYCNKTCQRNEWKFHKEECKGNRRIAPLIVKDSTRLMLRLIIRSKWSSDTESSAEAFGQRRSLEDLMSHKESIKSDISRCQEFLQLCLSLKAFVGDEFDLPESDELLELFGKMCINSFSICDPEMKPIGAGLYLGPSVLDHSCQPNAVAVFDSRQLHVRCIEPIYEGQKVFISYIDLLETVDERRDSLKRSYYFRCDCSSCLDEERTSSCSGLGLEGGEPTAHCRWEDKMVRERTSHPPSYAEAKKMKSLTFHTHGCSSLLLGFERDALMRSSLCPNEHCSGPVVQDKDRNFLPCKTCGQLEVGVSYRERTAEAMAKVAEVLRKLKDLESERKFAEHLHIAEACVRDIKDVLHPLNVNYGRLLDAAFDGCIGVCDFEKALDYGIRVLEPYRYYLPKYHPLLGIHLMKVGKIQLLLEKTKDAFKSLKQAEAILQATHGSSQVQEELDQMINQCQMELSSIQPS